MPNIIRTFYLLQTVLYEARWLAVYRTKHVAQKFEMKQELCLDHNGMTVIKFNHAAKF